MWGFGCITSLAYDQTSILLEHLLCTPEQSLSLGTFLVISLHCSLAASYCFVLFCFLFLFVVRAMNLKQPVDGNRSKPPPPVVPEPDAATSGAAAVKIFFEASGNTISAPAGVVTTRAAAPVVYIESAAAVGALGSGVDVVAVVPVVASGSGFGVAAAAPVVVVSPD